LQFEPPQDERFASLEAEMIVRFFSPFCETLENLKFRVENYEKVKEGMGARYVELDNPRKIILLHN